MIILYVLLSIVALVLAVLIINLRITVKYGMHSYIKLGALFFDFDLTTKKNKKVTSSKLSKSSDKCENRVSKSSKGILSEFTEGLSISDFLYLLKKLLFRLVEASSGHIKVKVKRFEVTIADKYPATAAMLYGGVNAAASWLFEYLEVNTKLFPLKKSNIYVNCDFNKEKTEAEIELCAKIRTVHLLKFILKFFFDFIKLKETKNQTSLKGTK